MHNHSRCSTKTFSTIQRNDCAAQMLLRNTLIAPILTGYHSMDPTVCVRTICMVCVLPASLHEQDSGRGSSIGNPSGQSTTAWACAHHNKIELFPRNHGKFWREIVNLLLSSVMREQQSM
jgi:hypothetical protein